MRIRPKLSTIELYAAAKGLSVRQLVRRAGIPDSTWYKVVEGKRGAGPDVIVKLMSACPELTFEDLFFVGRELPIGNGRPAMGE